jgi:hypothetical protein
VTAPAPSRPGRPRPYRKHGAFALKRAVRTLGSRTIDRRTRVGRALAAWCADLARDLGGADALSTAQRALIEQAATTRLILDSIDGWLATQPSLIDRRKRALLPVVRERQSLADALVRYLTALGLERKARDVTDLASYLAARPTTSPATAPPPAEAAGPGAEPAPPERPA